jgi:hypothetical protein
MDETDYDRYAVRRYYRDDDERNGRIISRGLTLEEAQEHCRAESTHADIDSTGTRPWFDGYEKEG